MGANVQNRRKHSVDGAWCMGVDNEAMDDLRPMLETILMRRISNAVSTLPDRGMRPTPLRAEAVRETVEVFIDDLNTIVESEFRPYCRTGSTFEFP